MIKSIVYFCVDIIQLCFECSNIMALLL